MTIINYDILKATVPTILPSAQGKPVERYNSAMQEAEQWLSSRVLNSKLIETLATDSAYSALKTQVAKVLAYKTYHIAIPTIDLVESANGFAVVNDNNLVPASKERVAALRESMLSGINISLDLLLEMLENEPKLHGEWEKTLSYSLVTEWYFKSLTEFRRIGHFDGNRIDWINALPRLKAIGIRDIENWLSAEYATHLKMGKDLTDDDKSVLKDVRYAIGLMWNNDNAAGITFLRHARDRMMNDIDKYPVFKSSQLYTRLTTSINRDKSIFIGV